MVIRVGSQGAGERCPLPADKACALFQQRHLAPSVVLQLDFSPRIRYA